MSEKRKFQLSVKFGPGFEAPMLNVEGDDADEFQANVAFAVSNADHIVDAAVLFQAGYNVKKPQDNPPAQQGSWSNNGSQRNSQPAQAPSDRPEGPAPSCRHGDMKWVPGGISKRTNKAYKGFWGCTGDRSEQCESVNA